MAFKSTFRGCYNDYGTNIRSFCEPMSYFSGLDVFILANTAISSTHCDRKQTFRHLWPSDETLTRVGVTTRWRVFDI